MPALTRASRRIGFGSSTLATPRAIALTGPWDPRRIGTMPATPRIAGRRTTTSRSRIGVRLDYQKVGYGDAIRKPIITDGIFPAQTNVAADTLVKNTNVAPRLGLTYDLTGKGRTVLKAFYGRYYNNIADSFTGANPARLHDCGVQLPRPEPQRPLRRAVGARHASACDSAATRRWLIPITRRPRPRRSARRSRPSCRASRRRV